ncbi:unnamed protein product [Phytophthora fragariaefolia]|uniref:Unnamed protein product n=1 Tax=Phytophthora fragariaefolia TaxID=1490495 RepID=A0A9W6XZN2_9STRA|nr:unnamed protein product [Phytophthora fragariaefolia]
MSEILEELRVGNLREEDFDRLELAKKRLSCSKDAGFFFIEGVATCLAPEVDVGAFELKICGVKRGEVSLSLTDLKTRFKQHSVITMIRCATPRADAVAGCKSATTSERVPAEWTGVLLADVLAGVGITAADIKQIRFEALDTDAEGGAFGTSISAATALDREVGVILAYEMNSAPIPKEHGFPLRVVVPGTTGSGNVKFVCRIILT